MAKAIYETVLDEYTCEGCLERHGREVKANDKPFSVCKNIDTDIGCRCVLKESKEITKEYMQVTKASPIHCARCDQPGAIHRVTCLMTDPAFNEVLCCSCLRDWGKDCSCIEKEIENDI